MADLWRRVAFTSGARVYSMLMGLVTLVLTARALGPEGRGVVAAATAWAMLYFSVANLSLGQIALSRAAQRPGQEWVAGIVRSLFTVATAMTLLVWLVGAGTYVLSGGDFYSGLSGVVMLLALATVPFLIWEQYSSSLLMALGKLSVYNRAQVVGRTAGLVLVVVLLFGVGTGAASALFALLVAQFLVASAGARTLLAAARGSGREARAALRPLLSDGAKLHLNAVGTVLFTTGSTILVARYRGPAETGHFQLAVALTGVAAIIPQAASMVLYGEVARDGPDAAWSVNRRVLLWLTGLMGMLAIAGAALAPFAIPLLVGDEFRPAVPVFQLLTIGLVGQSLSMLMAPQWIGRGLFWQVSALSLATGVATLAACLALVPRHGMYGAAWATVGVYLFSILANGGMALWVEQRVRGRTHGGIDPPPR